MIPELARASTIPSSWYTRPEVLALEEERVFLHTWQAVGQAAQVASPGDYFSFEVAGEPLAVVRGADGVLRAFSNVCRHRASIILRGHGRTKSLRCPYHAWIYSLDGKLLGAPEFEGVENWDKSDICLPSVPVEVWGPFIFVNFDGQAPALAEVMGDIPARVSEIGCDLDRLRFSHRLDYVINCNWKVYIDNYLEGYHLPAAHPSLFRELDYNQYRVETFRYYSSQHAPLRPAKPGQTRRYPDSDGSGRALYYWIFPNFMLNVYPDNMSSNVILPLGHDRTVTIFEWYTYGDGEVAKETLDFSDEIQQEDITICENVQKGLQSRTYDRGRYSVKRENGVYHFHALLEEFLGGALD